MTGGFVYRGTTIPALVGTYVFTDYCDGALRILTPSATATYRARDLDIDVDSVSSFGQATDGELYVLSQSDGIFRTGPS